MEFVSLCTGHDGYTHVLAEDGRVYLLGEWAPEMVSEKHGLCCPYSVEEYAANPCPEAFRTLGEAIAALCIGHR